MIVAALNDSAVPRNDQKNHVGLHRGSADFSGTDPPHEHTPYGKRGPVKAGSHYCPRKLILTAMFQALPFPVPDNDLTGLTPDVFAGATRET